MACEIGAWRRGIGLLAVVGACGAALPLWGAGFWESKPYQNWSAREVQQMRTASPWAHAVTAMVPAEDLLAPAGPGPGRATGVAAAESSGGGGGRGGGRGGPRGGDDADALPGNMRAVEMTIRWQSALPVRHAGLREKFGDQVLQSPDAVKAAQGDEAGYVIVVTGIPLLNERVLPGGLAKALGEGATLTAKGRQPLRPTDIHVDAVPRGRTMEITFTFPRTEAIVREDQEVEFSLSVGHVRAKAKFRLKDMMYRDGLAL